MYNSIKYQKIKRIKLTGFLTVLTFLVMSVTYAQQTLLNNLVNLSVDLEFLSDGVTPRPAGTEFVVTDSGTVGIGLSNPTSNYNLKINSLANGDIFEYLFDKTRPALSLVGTDFINRPTINNKSITDNPSKSAIYYATRSRGVFGAQTAVLDGDVIGSYSTNAHNGTTNIRSSSINTIATNDWNVETDAAIQFLVSNETGNNEKMRIDSDGNVGIGTDAPNEKLEVNGKVRISDLTGADLGTDVIVTADATTGELKEGGTLSSLGLDTTDDPWVNNGTQVELGALADGITPRPAGTEMVITDEGKTFIGAPNPYPDSIFQVGSRSDGDLSDLSYTESATLAAFGLKTNGIMPFLYIKSVSNQTGSPKIAIGRSRGNIGAEETVNNHDIIGIFQVTSYDNVLATNIVSTGIATVASNDWDVETDADLIFLTRNEIEYSEKMRIDSDGNIGIGTNTPNEKLEVNGKVRVSDLTGADLGTDVIVTADATTGELKEGGTLSSLGLDTTDDPWVNNATSVELGTLADGVTPRPAGTEFVIADDGSISLGATVAHDPNYKIYIEDSDGIQIFNSDNSITPKINIVAFTGNFADKAARYQAAIFRGTKDARLPVLEDDTTLKLVSYGSGDGVGLEKVASINFEIDGTPGPEDMPGRIVFETTPDNEKLSVERMVIKNDGNVGIGTDAPNEKLEINGKVRISDLTGANLGTDVLVTADATTGELKDGGTLSSLGLDTTDDPWVNNGTSVELGTLADGVTPRPAGTEVIITDTGALSVGVSQANIRPDALLSVGSFADGGDFEFGIHGSSGAVGIRGEGDTAVGYNTQSISDISDESAYMLIHRARGTFAAPEVILNNDDLGVFGTRGHDGTRLLMATSISSVATNDWAVEKDADMKFSTRNESGLSERMRIDSDGNVGIGTVAPDHNLEVAGTMQVDSYFYFGDESTDGNWRVSTQAGILTFEKREAGVWVSKIEME